MCHVLPSQKTYSHVCIDNKAATVETDSSGKLGSQHTRTERQSGNQPDFESGGGGSKLCNHLTAIEGQSCSQPAFEGSGGAVIQCREGGGCTKPFQRGLVPLQTSDRCMDSFQSVRDIRFPKVRIPAAPGGIYPGPQQGGIVFSAVAHGLLYSASAPAAHGGVLPEPQLGVQSTQLLQLLHFIQLLHLHLVVASHRNPSKGVQFTLLLHLAQFTKFLFLQHLMASCWDPSKGVQSTQLLHLQQVVTSHQDSNMVVQPTQLNY